MAGYDFTAAGPSVGPGVTGCLRRRISLFIFPQGGGVSFAGRIALESLLAFFFFFFPDAADLPGPWDDPDRGRDEFV